jgi:hypothetical protein
LIDIFRAVSAFAIAGYPGLRRGFPAIVAHRFEA